MAETTTYCAEHEDTTSSLRCARCEKLVCPKCMVQAPVGIRCREHGKAPKPPMYQVSRGYIARGFGAAIVVGVVGGIVLAFAVPFLEDFYGGIAVAGVGYLVGEAISRATNYKRGTPLVVASVVGMVVALVAFLAVLGGAPTLFELLGLGAGTYYAVTRVR
ncbi:MAG: B-box zinc finger protein [SAR202 cluster bacterium]|nr:B-box zinc finger protein [SAR202 cluster bacterium]